MCDDIGLGHAAIAAAARDGLGVELVVLDHLARRRHQIALIRELLRRLRHRRRRPLGRLGHGRRRIGCGIYDGNHFTRDDGAPVRLDDLGDDAPHRRRQFQHHLVGFDIDQIFVAGDGVAHLFVPAEQRGFGHGFGQLRHFHFD